MRYFQKPEAPKKAYELKESFGRWLERAKENGGEDVLQTEEERCQFSQYVEVSGIEALQRCVRTLRNWIMEILNSLFLAARMAFWKGSMTERKG